MLAENLTYDAVRVLAGKVASSPLAVINGRLSASHSGAVFGSINPATGKTIAQIAECSQIDIDTAVAGARRAFDRHWSRMTPADRKRRILTFAELIERNAEELAVLESVEGGKPISDTLKIDVPETVNTIRWHAEATDKLYDKISPSGPNVVGMIRREPVGVVAAILPWNFPLMMAAWKLGPILATGCTVLLKPAEQTSLTTIRLGELALEAGIPEGVVNVLPGRGEVTGRGIGLHNEIDCVTFTGSTEIGRLFLKYAADSNLKRVLLECGGKNPAVVLADAANLDIVADHVVNSVYWNAGQNCSSNSRLIVHRSIKNELLDHIVKKSQSWIVGDPLDPATRVGALIEAEHLEKVLKHIGAAKDAGATLVAGGNRTLTNSGGYFVEPTIFDDVSRNMRLAREEVFGPVLAVMTVDSVDEALHLANDTEYGLAASLFTQDVRVAHIAANAIKAGTVTVNCYGEGDISTPFGGYRSSGFFGRDKSIMAHAQYCEMKTVWMDLA